MVPWRYFAAASFIRDRHKLHKRLPDDGKTNYRAFLNVIPADTAALVYCDKLLNTF